MKILRKLIAFVIYGALLLPGSEYRMTAWVRAIEVTSTAFDKTLRRRKSRLENERFIRHLIVMRMDEDQEEKTMRRKSELSATIQTGIRTIADSHAPSTSPITTATTST
jgi:hypothetical protein